MDPLDEVLLSWKEIAANVSATPHEFCSTLTAENDADGQRLSVESSGTIREDLVLWFSHQQDQTQWPETFDACINTPESTVLKTFFTTQDGRMGLGNEVKPGNEVCILFGGQAPFLLREAESGMFELIEDCYINGLMDGKQ